MPRTKSTAPKPVCPVCGKHATLQTLEIGEARKKGYYYRCAHCYQRLLRVESVLVASTRACALDAWNAAVGGEEGRSYGME